MAIYPDAVYKPVAWAMRPARLRRRGQIPNVAINHVAVSALTTTSLFGFFNNPANNVCSHLFIDYYSGTVEQYIDTKYMSAAAVEGSNRSVCIEFGGGKGADINKGFSAAQIASAIKVYIWLHETHGIPLQVIHDSKPSSIGIGWHRLGVPRSKYTPASEPGWLVPGGERWSGAVGKICPGPGRTKQIPGMVKDARALLSGGGAAPTPGDTQTPPRPSVKEWPHVRLEEDRYFGPVSKRAYQRLLAGIGQYAGLIDGDFAYMSICAEQRWLRGLGWYRGLIDGKRLALTITALQRFLKHKGLYIGIIEVDHGLPPYFGPLNVLALQQYLNQQRKYFL